MYGRPNRRPVDGFVDELQCVETARPYPALSFSGNELLAAAWRRSSPTAACCRSCSTRSPSSSSSTRSSARSSRLGSLLPLDLEPVLDSVARTGALVTVEEGTLTGGVGAEIAARVQEEAWDDLRRPVRRVAATDGVIPAARDLEEAALPGVAEVVDAIVALAGVRS